MHFNMGDPKKLLILMEGGGACYNSSTCTLSLAIHPFGASALDTPAIAEVYGTNIFNRDDPENPHVVFQNNNRGYVRCTVTPDAWTSEFRAVSTVTSPHADVWTVATLTVENGAGAPCAPSGH